MAKSSTTLEEGLNRSANKRGFTGKERHRYIGGALHNMGKAKTRAGKREPATHKPSTAPATRKPYVKPTITKTTTKKAYQKPSMVKRVRISLVAKKNTEASKGKPYDVYSIYKSGEKTPYTSQTFRKLSTAKHEAKIAQDEHNEGYKRGRF